MEELFIDHTDEDREKGSDEIEIEIEFEWKIIVLQKRN